jgi:PAS domain S-box-containing protein
MSQTEDSSPVTSGPTAQADQSSLILIVDDDRVVREALKALLTTAKYRLAFASNGAEALKLATQLVPDLILMDVVMPDIDGITVCRQLRVNPLLAEIPIILLTGLTDREVRIKGIQAGADDFMSKQFDVVELLARVRTITRLSRYRRIVAERANSERLIELSPDGVAIVNLDLRVLLANAALQRLVHGARPPTIVGRRVLDFIEPEQHELFSAWLQHTIRDGQASAHIDTTLRTEQGQLIPIDVHAGYVNWEGDPATQIVVRNASERKRAEAQRQRQLERLQALREIDQAINSSHDLQLTLRMVLHQLTMQLQVYAAAIFLIDPHSQILTFAAGQGDIPQQRDLRLGEGLAGRVALERQRISIPNRTEALNAPEHTLDPRFQAYYGVPLIARGKVKGILEVFHHMPLAPDSEWLDFLEALAAQAAIAIESATLVGNLRRTQDDLALAYDATLESWARAVEQRAREPEGHTLEAAEMALRIARAMHMSDAELTHIRRGALLHDIGTLAVPETVLLKSGPLSADEWALMQKHPVYAHEWLSSAPFLRLVADIPYCHHERWDGSGYPRGLRGEQIPPAARIFAVADVWRALTGPRLHRPAWSPEQTLAHIEEQSGTHFDPQVVATFCQIYSEYMRDERDR